MEQEPVCPVFWGLDPYMDFRYTYINGYAYSSSWDPQSSKKILSGFFVGNTWDCRGNRKCWDTPNSIPELKIHSKSAMNDYPMSWGMGIAEIGKLGSSIKKIMKLHVLSQAQKSYNKNIEK